MRQSFLTELKRRNVLRAAVLYVGLAWAISQGIVQLGPVFGMPDWATRWFVVACVVGFAPWVAFSWFFEFTPHGFKLDQNIAVDAPVRHSNARRLDFAIIGALSVVVVLLASGYFFRQILPGQAEASAAPLKSIAVLPFENLSGDKDNEYFVAGMQDLILTKLADIRDLKVISRSSAAKYASQPSDLRDVGRQLGVATVLEGSVQRSGNQVLINVQLIDVRTNAHIWAEAYTRNLDNIFGVEGEVAEKVASALKATLSTTESAQLAAVPTTNPVAYDLYLRGEHQAHLGATNYDTANLKSAIGFYRQAIASDAGFALAHASLSQAESELAWFGGGGQNIDELNHDARAHAELALRLAPGMALSHVALGYSDYYGRADYAGALRSFDAALAISPNDAGALAARGYVERRQGRFDAALASLQEALAHNPRSSTLAYDSGVTCMLLGRYPDAERWFTHALKLDPDNLNAKISYADAIVLRTGDIPRALAVVQGDAPRLRLKRADLMIWQRRYSDAIALLKSVPDTPDNFPSNSESRALGLARLYRLAGDAVTASKLFTEALAHARTQLDQVHGINLAWAWSSIASAEFGLGDSAAGLDAVAKSNALVAKANDKVYGPNMLLMNAATYAEAGRTDLAVPLLADALATPGIGIAYSPAALRFDPAWDRVRQDTGFRALLQEYPAPAVSTSAR